MSDGINDAHKGGPLLNRESDFPMTVNTHSLSIGEPELKQPIPDYQIDNILGGVLIPNQATSKGLAREVKEMRQKLNISVGPKGESLSNHWPRTLWFHHYAR